MKLISRYGEIYEDVISLENIDDVFRYFNQKTESMFRRISFSFLNDWENNFLNSTRNQYYQNKKLTDKQLAKLENIYIKVFKITF